MRAFWQSLFLIAVAEMGDKSQRVSLAFATQSVPVLYWPECCVPRSWYILGRSHVEAVSITLYQNAG